MIGRDKGASGRPAVVLAALVLLTATGVAATGGLETSTSADDPTAADAGGPTEDIAEPDATPGNGNTDEPDVQRPASDASVFVPNHGQWHEDVEYALQSPAYSLFLTDTSAVTSITVDTHEREVSDGGPGDVAPPVTVDETYAVSMEFVGADADAEVTGVDERDHEVNYFTGDDEDDWAVGASAFDGVVFEDLYEGISVEWLTTGEQMPKYDLRVDPGADLGQVQIDIGGVDDLSTNDDGDLVLETDAGDVVKPEPVSWQVDEDGEREPVDVDYVVDGTTVGFAAEDRDEDKPLVVDPELDVGTYLGTEDRDLTFDSTVGPDGHVYAVTTTGSDDFPTKDGYQEENPGQATGSVTKFTQDGTDIVWSTYLGSSGVDLIPHLDVNEGGEVLFYGGYVGGDDYPTTDDAHQPDYNGGGYDTAFTHLAASGDELIYSTYVGGSDTENQGGIAFGPNGDYFVHAWTYSTDFPTTEDAFETEHPAGGDAQTSAVLKYDSDTGDLIWSTFVGGSDREFPGSLEVTDDGEPVITGNSVSTDYPTTSGAAQTEHGGASDIVVTKVAADGSDLAWSTYLGGGGADSAAGLAIADDGHIYVGGQTTSSDFPLVDAYDDERAGDADQVLAKLASDGSELVWSTLYGGTDDAAGSTSEYTAALSIGYGGHVYTAGWSDASDVPLVDPVQDENPGGTTGVVAAWTPDGEPMFASYLGTDDDDTMFNGGGDELRVLASGHSRGDGLPVSEDAYQPENPGGSSGIVGLVQVWDPPEPPVDLDAGPAGAGELQLEWSAPADSGDAPVDAYNVYRIEDETPTHVGTVDGNTTSFLDTGLEDDTTYTYAVSAVNEFGEGDLGDTVTATTLGPPSAPQNLEASTGTLAIDVEWDAPTETGGPELAEYVVFRSVNDGEFQEHARVDADSTSYSDEALVLADPLTCYTYEVTAVNDLGLEGPPSDPDTANDVPAVSASLTC